MEKKPDYIINVTVDSNFLKEVAFDNTYVEACRIIWNWYQENKLYQYSDIMFLVRDLQDALFALEDFGDDYMVQYVASILDAIVYDTKENTFYSLINTHDNNVMLHDNAMERNFPGSGFLHSNAIVRICGGYKEAPLTKIVTVNTKER